MRKKTWTFSFSSGALDWINRLPVTEIVEGEEWTYTSARRAGEQAAVKRAIRAAIKRRLAREGNILDSGTGTYEEESGKITIKFDPPGTEVS